MSFNSSSLLPDFPGPTLRQPATLATVAPAFLSIYAQAVLAILPNTFILKLSLLPFIMWQAWSCAVGLSLSTELPKSLGFEESELFRSWDAMFATAMMVMASKSFEWTFIKEPLRKYELSEGQDTPVERPLSVANVLLDALDLFFNHRGIGWSWSPCRFPRESNPPPSIASVFSETLLKFTILDTSQYILHLMAPYIDKTGGNNPFDSSLPILPRTALLLLATYFRGLWAYEQMELTYQIATLIGRIVLRQPASHWPPLSHKPWLATSIREFWSVRWHQFYRHFFIMCGARPGRVLLGKPGAVMGAFAVSGFLHMVGPWAAGYGMEFRRDGIFFFLMGVGVVLESTFERITGSGVRGWFGWLWAMAWMFFWGSLLVDLQGRLGIIAVEYFPDHLRPGKLLVIGACSLFSKCN